MGPEQSGKIWGGKQTHRRGEGLPLRGKRSGDITRKGKGKREKPSRPDMRGLGENY